MGAELSKSSIQENEKPIHFQKLSNSMQKLTQ